MMHWYATESRYGKGPKPGLVGETLNLTVEAALQARVPDHLIMANTRMEDYEFRAAKAILWTVPKDPLRLAEVQKSFLPDANVGSSKKGRKQQQGQKKTARKKGGKKVAESEQLSVSASDASAAISSVTDAPELTPETPEPAVDSISDFGTELKKEDQPSGGSPEWRSSLDS